MGPMGPMRLCEGRRATGNLGLQAQATCHAASGGSGPRAALLSWDPSKPGVTCDLAPGRPPRTLLWTKGHMEEDTFRPTCPLAYQTLGRLPSLALPSRHRQATTVNCLQLCHNLSSPRQASIPHTTTYNPQQPPGTSQETFLSCLQSHQDPHPQTWNSLYPLSTPLYLPADGPRQRGDSQLSREIPGDPGQPT